MIAILAEKPSVAREIAALVGANEKHEGWLAGNGYAVTWAFGHLVNLAMPADYGYKGFDIGTLPIMPEPFHLIPKKIKKGKEYVADTGALKQLGVIRDVFSKCNSIIVATDAGREGELIFRYIYEYLKSDLPFDRLWISSLTEKAIKNGLENIKPGAEFIGLYQAALARSRADWLIGINGTQALSIAAGDGLYSLGRVQTPTLALICQRFLQNKEFTIIPYYQIELLCRKDGISFKCLSQLKWDDQKKAEDIKRSIERNISSTIRSVERKTIDEQPPLLFDLTGLQKEANSKLNLTAEETLDIAQGLYEKKFITYPRTGSRYIPEDVWPEVPRLARALQDRESCKEATTQLKWGRLNKKIVNDVRVTDHHGLLPTEKIPSALSVKENAIYDMIALRLLEAISWPCVKEVTMVEIQALHYDFTTKATKIIEGGWRLIKGNFNENDDDTGMVAPLPDLQPGTGLDINEISLLRKETKPPALFTEASLLHAMEHAGTKTDCAETRKALQNIGIGTPATRAGIIETLFNRGYISRQKKSLVPTEKGLQVYEIVKDKKIANVSLTADYEIEMQRIENGTAGLNAFIEGIKQYTQSITKELLQVEVTRDKIPNLTCPKCKEADLLIRDKLVKCKDEACGWIQFRYVCGKQLSITAIQQLVEQGRTPLIKGMKSKSGKSFDASIVLDHQQKTVFEFANDDRGRKKT